MNEIRKRWKRIRKGLQKGEDILVKKKKDT